MREAPFAEAVRGVVARAGGDAARVRVLSQPSEECSGSAAAAGGELVLTGTSAVEACAAFARYLVEVVGQRITGDQPILDPAPSAWPDGSVEIATPFRIRYHLNVVTHGYSMPWWTWERWQRELDWMALHGVTHPMILTAYETLFAETLQRLGVPAVDAWAWVGGAAHTPWMAMGGVHDFGGPLPERWAERRVALARRILARAVELGMTPVLPLPGGQVPPALAEPGSGEIEWQGWRTPVLDPSSPRYRALVATFAGLQRERLGVEPGGVYALDPYIESLPPSGSASGLAAAGAGYVRALTAADPDATWLLQGWPFHYHRGFWTDERVGAFLSAVPHERLLLIDLWGEHAPMWRGGMHGRRWIWTAIHDFGGRFALFGDLRGLARDVDELRTLPERLEGVGLAPEAIEGDPVFYELATDLPWGATSIDSWLDAFAAQRYGSGATQAGEAWAILARTLYGLGRTRSIPSPVYARPWGPEAPFAAQRLAGEALPDPTTMSANIDAENDPAVLGDLPEIARAARLIASLGSSRPAAARDVADLTGHVLAQGTRRWIRAIVAGHRAGDAAAIERAAEALRRDLLDLDALMATRPESRVSTWIDAARAWGDIDAERDVLERDARSLVSVWGHQHSGLHDYSGRHWAGLIRHLHLPRWMAWSSWLADAARRAAKPDVAALHAEIVRLEEAWRSGRARDAASRAETIPFALEILGRLGY